MKISKKTMAVVLAIMMSLVAMQSAYAQIIAGTVEDVNESNNSILLDAEGTLYTINRIPIKCLVNKYDFGIEDYVYITYEEFICLDGTTKLLAEKVCMDDYDSACCSCAVKQKNRK